MIFKKCTKCFIEVELNGFNPSKRGLLGKRSVCKNCQSQYNSAYSKARIINDPEFRAKVIARATEWTKKNPVKRAQIAKRRNIKALNDFPEKTKARALVNQRVRHGRMPKASDQKCSNCSNTAEHYHHHKGYSFEFRYDVVPVCIKCHKLLH